MTRTRSDECDDLWFTRSLWAEDGVESIRPIRLREAGCDEDISPIAGGQGTPFDEVVPIAVGTDRDSGVDALDILPAELFIRYCAEHLENSISAAGGERRHDPSSEPRADLRHRYMIGAPVPARADSDSESSKPFGDVRRGGNGQPSLAATRYRNVPGARRLADPADLVVRHP